MAAAVLGNRCVAVIDLRGGSADRQGAAARADGAVNAVAPMHSAVSVAQHLQGAVGVSSPCSIVEQETEDLILETLTPEALEMEVRRAAQEVDCLLSEKRHDLQHSGQGGYAASGSSGGKQGKRLMSPPRDQRPPQRSRTDYGNGEGPAATVGLSPAFKMRQSPNVTEEQFHRPETSLSQSHPADEAPQRGSLPRSSSSSWVTTPPVRLSLSKEPRSAQPSFISPSQHRDENVRDNGNTARAPSGHVVAEQRKPRSTTLVSRLIAAAALTAPASLPDPSLSSTCKPLHTAAPDQNGLSLITSSTRSVVEAAHRHAIQRRERSPVQRGEVFFALMKDPATSRALLRLCIAHDRSFTGEIEWADLVQCIHTVTGCSQIGKEFCRELLQTTAPRVSYSDFVVAATKGIGGDSGGYSSTLPSESERGTCSDDAARQASPSAERAWL